ncbi:MAG: SPASM domain-containing protein [Deltaproteobacteria bacterium]|nr:SPASM domain-containing protein [Deltaproteobacteria bacterium]
METRSPTIFIDRPQIKKSSYDRILDRVLSVGDLVDVRLTGNFDPGNLESFKAHLRFMHEAGIHRIIKHLQIRPIIKSETNFGYDDSCGGQCSYKEVPGEQYLELRDFAAELDFPLLDTIAFGPCEAVIENAYNVDPYGDLYKCPAYVGNKEHAVGSVFSDALSDINDLYLSVEPFSDCHGCPFIPLCYGSCRYAADSFEEKLCDKPYFEQVVVPVLFRKARERSRAMDAHT